MKADTAQTLEIGARLGSLWAVIGVTSWTDAAAFLGALYSVLLIVEWIWKRFARPGLERRGIVHRKLRRSTDHGELVDGDSG